MDTFLTATELQDLANTVLTYNDYFKGHGIVLETTVVDSGGDHIGYIRWNRNDEAYVFVTDLSALD